MGLLPSKTTPSPSPPPPPNGTTPSPPPPQVGTTPSPPQQPPPVAAAPSPSPPVGNVLPLLANGQYAVGCADIMVGWVCVMDLPGDFVLFCCEFPRMTVHFPDIFFASEIPLFFLFLPPFAALEHRDGSCCWTYTLEQVLPPTPPPSPPLPTAVEGTPQQQNGPVPIAVVTAGAENTPPQTPTPPPPVPTTTHVKKPMEMRILPYDETEYETRIDQVKRRVAETVHMRRILAEMDANLLQNVTTDNNNDRQFGQQQILLGQTFDWAQFKNRLALDRCVCMGHSFGAASSLSACAEYPSLFNACVLLDAWLYPVERRMYPATVQPVLMLNASKWQWPRNVRRMQRLLAKATTATNDDKTATETTTTTAPQQQSQDGAATTAATAQPSVINTDSRMMFTIKDIVHQSFSDFGFLVPGRVARYIGVQGDLDPLLTGTAVLEMVLQFLESQFLHQQQQKEDEEDTEDEEGEEDELEEEEKEEEGEKESNERGGGGQSDVRTGQGEQDEVARSNASALDRLRRLVAEKYAAFVVEGTDIPQVKLDEVAPLVEAEQQQAVSAEEERKVANDSGVDTPPTTETTTEEAAEKIISPVVKE
ncbi:hypothetical protein niasHT_018429 [Heterodera trifolii]|uniref:1-alkyl-2-acetylglycerophosphocholine esterase n=1 Tax=Heterodera trifolii TaxID=157864 RepID=A0ABD2KWH3_9BILA